MVFSGEAIAIAAISARCFGVLVCLPIADGIQHLPRLFIAILFALALSQGSPAPEGYTLFWLGPEFLIGVLIAAPLRFAAEAGHMFGELIDTARGQLMSSVIDPLNGPQVSDMAAIARLAVVALALHLGALEMCVESLKYSYELYPLDNQMVFEDGIADVLRRAFALLKAAVGLASVWFVSYVAIDIIAALLAKVMQGLSFGSAATIAKMVVTLLLFLNLVAEPQELAEVVKRYVLKGPSIRISTNRTSSGAQP